MRKYTLVIDRECHTFKNYWKIYANVDKNFKFVRKCPGRMLILVLSLTCVIYILILYSTLDNVHFIDIAQTVHLIGVQRHCKSDERSLL